MNETREFHLGAVLSIVSERLVAPNRMEGVYEILNYLTDDDLFTHQLPMASRLCRPWILEQHPQLDSPELQAAIADLDASLDGVGINDERESIVDKWLESQVAIHGESLPLKPLKPGVRTHSDPIEDLISMIGPEKVVVFTAPTT